MNSAKLSQRILDCLERNSDREEQEATLYNEISQIDSHIIRAIIVNLCEEIEELKKENGDIDLLALEAGETFKINGVEYIVLEQLANNQTAVIRKELLKDEMEFDSYNNNWKTSSIREFLNGEYLEEIENVFGNSRIINHTVDLLSLDGLDYYGTCIDKVSLLSIDQYRKYRKMFGENMDNWWWLLTPDSMPSGRSSHLVQCINPDGYVFCRGCNYDGGVRPFFILQS